MILIIYNPPNVIFAGFDKIVYPFQFTETSNVMGLMCVLIG